MSWALRLKGLERALRVLATARFAHALGLMYRVGIPLSSSLPLAAQSVENPVLEAGVPRALAALSNGANLSQCLATFDFFPRLFLSMVAAAETVGNVDGTMEWVARFYEQELESSLERLLSLIEPILMLCMGIVVGVMLLATMLPMVSVLDHL